MLWDLRRRLILASVLGLLLLTSPVYAETAAPCPAVTVRFTPGENCTERIVTTLSEAKTSLLVQAYSFTLAPIAKALVDAKKRGVRVEVILELIASTP